MLMPFQNSPFPLMERRAQAFFDVTVDGRRGRNSARGGLLWEDSTYYDNRVLVSVPAKFHAKRPPVFVVFLHGNQATLERDVRDRQQVVAQVRAANINAVLLAPQLAVDALDSSPGNFAEPFFFKQFLAEAANKIGAWKNSEKLRQQLKHASVFIVAYSGGYMAAANILEIGGANTRIDGVILLDALYDNEDTFAQWISDYHHRSFFFSTYTESARASNELLQTALRNKRVRFHQGIPSTLSKKQVGFLSLPKDMDHMDLMTKAWSETPLTDLLHKVREKK